MENKVIFESDEEARAFCKACSFDKFNEIYFYNRIKELNHIRKSPVEEAEEMYVILDLNNIRNWCESTYQYIVKSKQAIQELKSENEKLKNK